MKRARLEELPPIRLISLESLQRRKPRTFPRYPDDKALCVTLESIDRSTSFVVFVSHCWLRGWSGAEGWDGRPHPDNAQHEKFNLIVEGVEKAWQVLASGMTECYIWIDFGCMNQDADPCGELRQLDKIVQSCDCMFTPIVDSDWKAWGDVWHSVNNLLEWHRAPLWIDGPFAYLNRAWCRMEMLYAANLDLHEDVEQRRDKFSAGLKSAAHKNFRPHLLYSTRESQAFGGLQPIMLPPLQNSFADTHSPATGAITKETDRVKIAELMGALEIRHVSELYEGERDSDGQRHGHGRMTWASGDVYDGQWEHDKQNGVGVIIYADGSCYSGGWNRGVMQGTGTFTWADADQYEGQWLNDRPHGYGVFRWANGDLFEGQLVQGFAQGIATFKEATGTYEGLWVRDKKHGFGKYTYADGGVYQGEWDNDMRHGQGKFFLSARGGGGAVAVHEGRWECGAFVKEGIRVRGEGE